ncbi:secretin N-terminal domain-containing protein [Pseudomonas mangiferae]|uniref:Secretin n=1 Tax=Pseudomonas mangiferae TaxID=2593654 RepID=A0A553H414_9PSED|nr:secretin N-terminal domain-containing protein [Pseudomonas mangiferae]TRX76493.1 secretin [Pseudomonas mangiferae]
MTLRPPLLALLLACSLPLHAETEVIPLNYRTPEDILPTLQAVVGNSGRISAYGSQLIVNASPGKIQEIRSLLAQLDTRPKRLLITVDTNENRSDDASGYSVNGSASVGGVHVETGQGAGRGRDQVRIINRSTQGRTGSSQQIQASEGYPALIQVGQNVPLTTTSRDPYGRVYQSTQYSAVTRGFYVTAQVTGETVHVALSSNNDRLSQTRPGVIDVQSADTQVTGRLGEWLTVGGVSEDSQYDSNGVLQHRATQGRSDTQIRLKVDLAE